MADLVYIANRNKELVQSQGVRDYQFCATSKKSCPGKSNPKNTDWKWKCFRRSARKIASPVSREMRIFEKFQYLFVFIIFIVLIQILEDGHGKDAVLSIFCSWFSAIFFYSIRVSNTIFILWKKGILYFSFSLFFQDIFSAIMSSLLSVISW